MKLTALATALCLAAAGLVAAAPGGTAAVRPATAATAPVSWGRCSDAGLRQAGARCGFVTVPLDYAHPGGRTIKLAVSRVRHTVDGSQVPRRHAGQPRRPRRLRPRPFGARPGDRRTSSAGRGRGLRLDRLRPARRRVQRARAVLRPRLLRLRPAELRAEHARARQAWLAAPAATPAACAAGRPALLRHMRPPTPSATWTHPQGAGPAADQLLRLLLRHLPRAGLRHAVPGAGAPDGPRQQRRPAPGLVPGQPRPGPSPSTATSASSSTGSPSTTPSTTWAPRGTQSAQLLRAGHDRSSRPRRSAASSAPTSGTTSS